MGKSELEDQFLMMLLAEQRRNNIRLPYPEREFRFHPTRKWRFDFAWPTLQVAVEIEGGIWNAGRHATGAGILADMEKYNAATALGWRVLRFCDRHMKQPDEMFQTILETFGALDPTER